MSVVAMKKLTLFGITAQRRDVLATMQKLGCLELIRKDGEAPDCLDEAAARRTTQEREQIEAKVALYEAALRFLRRVKPEKKPLLAPPRYVHYEALENDPNARMLDEVAEQLGEMEAYLRDLGARHTQLAQERAQLLPWAKLDVAPERLRVGRSCAHWLGFVPLKTMEELRATLKLELPLAATMELESTREGQALWILAHASQWEGVQEALTKCGATAALLPSPEVAPPERIKQLDALLSELETESKFLQDGMAALAEHRQGMERRLDALYTWRERAKAAEEALHTQKAYCMRFWAPAERQQEIETKLQAKTMDLVFRWEEPTEDEHPPTLLQEKPWVSPFNSITEMFSPVSYRDDIDPNFAMMPFFLSFFGMMVSDAGYGILMMIATICMLRFVKPAKGLRRMVLVLCIGGAATVFWGALFGGWFSIEGIPPLLFAPMDQPVQMLILCYSLGLLHMIVGLGLKAANLIRKGHIADAIWDAGSWMVLLAGIPVAALHMQAGLIVMLIGALGVLLFAGREHKNPLRRLLGGLGSLYGISSYISDILSYSRLFAMGLATGVIGLVVNTVAKMLIGTPPHFGVGFIGAILVLLIGHTFNIVINMLGAYVHACRLQYIEFYGKFYTGGGRVMKPLEYSEKYVRIMRGADAAMK